MNYRIRPVGLGREDIFQISDACRDILYICRWYRRRLYEQGIKQRVANLAKVYGLDRIDVIPKGIFIDCGANVGELGLWARDENLDYVPFEPEILEAECCDLNNFDGRAKTRRYALWNESKVTDFYSKPESADSSIIEMAEPTRQARVNAVRLDTALDTNQLSSVSGTTILKVEAEGAEPEVLEGAAGVLPYIDWVAVDCSPERGTERANTLVETNGLMYEYGFQLCWAQVFGRVTALYRNVKCGPWQPKRHPKLIE